MRYRILQTSYLSCTLTTVCRRVYAATAQYLCAARTRLRHRLLLADLRYARIARTSRAAHTSRPAHAHADALARYFSIIMRAHR